MDGSTTTPQAPSRDQVVALAALLAVAGIVLVLRPFDDTSRLARLIGVGLILLGVDFFVSARSSTAARVPAGVNAVAWGATGLAVLVWPSPTVRELAIWIGVGLIATGVIEVGAALRNRRAGRWIEVLVGVSSVLFGVAAVAAPATNLKALFEENVGTTFGDVLASFALVSWQRFYGIDLDEIVTAQAIPVIERISGQCLQDDAQMLAVFPEAELLKIEFFRVQPWDTEPWSTILDENTPGSTRIDAPVLITQGSVDPLVLPTVQQVFVDDWCDSGQALEYRVYDGVGHLDAGRASAADVADWVEQRLDGEAWQPTCGG